VNFIACSFDDGALQVGAPSGDALLTVNCISCHFENPSNSTNVFVQNGGQNVSLRDCSFVQDNATTISSFISHANNASAAGKMIVDGADFFNSGTTMSAAIAIGSGTNAQLVVSGTKRLKGVTSIYSNSGTASIISGVTLKKGSGAGNYTSTSTSFVAVDGTNLILTTIIPVGWNLVINASGLITSATAAVPVFYALADGGSVVVQSELTPPGAGSPQSFALNWVIAGDGNSHTVDLRYSTSNASDAVTMGNNSSTLTPTMVFNLVQA
jgi:hypothetical protein